jgi:hypothetical protein
MNATWKAAIGVILVFILGWVGGALITLLIMHHRMTVLVRSDPEQMAILLERQTTRNLGLDENQKKQIHALLVENLRERTQLQRQIQPQVRSVNGQTLQQIDAVLTADQQQKFQLNLLRFKQRFGRNPLYAGPDGAPVPPDSVPVKGATNAAVASPPAK